MRLLWFVVVLLFAFSSGQDAVQQQQQQQQATVVSGDAAAATVEGLTDATDKTNSNATTTQDKQRFPSPDAILSQMPPIVPPRSGIPSMDAFYMMFPALSSLLRWGSLFPAQSILGAVPDNLDSSASKVVLVLADDANAQKSRVTRQNAPSQSVNPLNAPAMLQQMVSQMQQSQLGQAMTAQSWMPEGFPSLPPMPQMPAMDTFNLGMSLPALDGLLGAPPPAPPAPAVTPAPPAAKSATDNAPAAPAPAPLPFSAFFDGTNNMLGSALAGMPPAPSPDSFMAGLRQFWPGAAPAAADRSAQASDISEVRVKPETREGEENGDDDRADTINYRDPQQTEAQLAQLKLKSALQMEQEKQKRVPLLWFRMPTSSSRNEAEPKTTDQLEIESKLQSFERQVINELKLLQQIENLAREMRANAQGTSMNPAYKLRYPLSRTPVHKITRSDIERALRDDYVRRLLQKEAQRKTQRDSHMAGFKRQTTTMNTDPTLSKEDIINVMAYAYRQANEAAQQKPKEDKIYAAYRAENPMTMAQQMEKKKAEQELRQEMLMMRAMGMENPQSRQWISKDQAQMAQDQQQRQMMDEMNKTQQQQMMLMQQRQMEQQMQQQQQHLMQRQQQQMRMEQQRAMEQQQQQQSDSQMRLGEQIAERQWADTKMKAMQQQQMEQKQQRQWSEAQQMKTMQQQQMDQQQQRQWSEAQQVKSMQQQQMEEQQQQQQPRQWSEAQQTKMMHQQQMEEQQQQQQPRQWSEAQQVKTMQQQRQQKPMQQRQMTDDQQNMRMEEQQQRQWADETMKQIQQQQQQQQMEQQRQQQLQQRSMEEQQRQMGTQQMLQQMQQSVPDERQWSEEKIQMIQQQQQLSQQQQQQQQRQWTEDQLKNPQIIQEDKAEEAPTVGEATPQMPEADGKARHKVDALGLGGNHHKKSKSHGPTIINYYQQAPPQRPHYQHYMPSYPSYPSYGTSYGGGAYGSNAYGGGAYRAAVGNDEIDSMLRQHQVMAATHFRQ